MEHVAFTRMRKDTREHKIHLSIRIHLSFNKNSFIYKHDDLALKHV